MNFDFTSTAFPSSYFSNPSHWFPVSSSNVHSIAHFLDPGSGAMILGVRFRIKNTNSVSAEYWYYGASYALFLSMMGSGSKGQFVWQALRGRYRYTRVK